MRRCKFCGATEKGRLYNYLYSTIVFVFPRSSVIVGIKSPILSKVAVMRNCKILFEWKLFVYLFYEFWIYLWHFLYNWRSYNKNQIVAKSFLWKLSNFVNRQYQSLVVAGIPWAGSLVKRLKFFQFRHLFT